MMATHRTSCVLWAVLTSATILAQYAHADTVNDLHTSGPSLDWVEYHNATADFHKETEDALKADHRLISLSLAGSVGAPRYAAIWVKATAPDQHFSAIINGVGNPCCGQLAFDQKISTEARLGYYPVLVAAVGTDPGSATYATVFERTAKPVVLTGVAGASDFASQNKFERSQGTMLRWATVFGTAAAPIYFGLYEALSIPGGSAKALPRWADSVTDDQDAFNEEFDAYEKEWVRPGILAGAPDGTFFAAWYDSLLKSAPTTGAQAFAYPDVDAAYLDELIAFAQGDGLLPMQVQAVERGGSLHYSVVFGDQASILKDPDRRLLGLHRKFVSNGSPDLTIDPTFQPFDDGMKTFMHNNGTRAATLAVSKNGRLVFAHAYTWAEVDAGYPTTTPFNRFRIGSASKIFTMLLACRLEENGVLSLDDLLMNDLASPPTPGDSRFSLITLRGLLAHRSGMPRAAADPPVISKAQHGGAVILPISRNDQTRYEVKNAVLLSNPAAEFHYSNLGYYFVGEASAYRTAVGYEDAVRDIVFPSLFPPTHHPVVTKSTFEDQSPDEVRYHTNSLKLVQSVVDSAQPLVPNQYGGNDYNLKAASGGWSASAAQLAKMMAVFTLPHGMTNPMLDARHLHDSAGNGMLDVLKLSEPCPGLPSFTCVTQDGTKTMGGLKINSSLTSPNCDIPVFVTSYEKNGGVPGIKAWAITRTDGLTMTVVVNNDTAVTPCQLHKWAAQVDWSKVPMSTDYFPTYNIHAY
jgi:CubicO group peptidase (beta-lactamase class C family)